MFNVGGPEVLIIALVALVVVGPEQLPAVLRKAGQYAAQMRQMSNSLRQEFMAGVDELDPTKWDTKENAAESNNGDDAKGTLANPIVPRGYAERVAAGDPDNPFSPKPVSQKMAEPTPSEAAAEAEAAAVRASKKAEEAADRAARLRAEAEAEAASVMSSPELSGSEPTESGSSEILDAPNAGEQT